MVTQDVSVKGFTEKEKELLLNALKKIKGSINSGIWEIEDKYQNSDRVINYLFLIKMDIHKNIQEVEENK